MHCSPWHFLLGWGITFRWAPMRVKRIETRHFRANCTILLLSDVLLLLSTSDVAYFCNRRLRRRVTKKKIKYHQNKKQSISVQSQAATHHYVWRTSLKYWDKLASESNVLPFAISKIYICLLKSKITHGMRRTIYKTRVTLIHPTPVGCCCNAAVTGWLCKCTLFLSDNLLE